MREQAVRGMCDATSRLSRKPSTQEGPPTTYTVRRRERRGPPGGLITLAGGAFAYQEKGGATGAPSRLV